jgi:uncharacterized protein YbjT (DUF2867 family)
VDIREGDLADADFLSRSTQDADALFLVDPTDFAADDPNIVSEQLGRIAAEAVRRNGIPRVLFQSSVGAEKRHGAGLIDGLARIEEQLDATNADVLHLRCGYFLHQPAARGGVATRRRVTTTMWPDAPTPRPAGACSRPA